MVFTTKPAFFRTPSLLINLSLLVNFFAPFFPEFKFFFERESGNFLTVCTLSDGDKRAIPLYISTINFFEPPEKSIETGNVLIAALLAEFGSDLSFKIPFSKL